MKFRSIILRAKMSYLTPTQILDQATYAKPQDRARQYDTSVSMGVVPAHLHTQSPYYSTSRPSHYQSAISTNYAGHTHDANASLEDYYHRTTSLSQCQKSLPTMDLSRGSSRAPESPSVPITSFSNNHPYATSSVVLGPLSERRNSQDIGPCHQSIYGAPVKRKRSGGGTCNGYPDYLNLPPEYWNAPTEARKEFEYPNYLNLPPEYRRNSSDIQKQADYPHYLNLPPEYRTNPSQAGIGPVRSPGHAVHTQNPYPFTSPPSRNPPQSPESSKRRRGDPQPNRYPADPFPIVKDGRGPTNHVRVPQRVFHDETDLNRCMSYSKPITFRMKNFAELGVRLSDCLDENHLRHPNIEDKDAKLFTNDEVYREIRLKILWPGYYEFPFTRRINIRKGEMSKISLLFNVVMAIADFVKKIQSDRDCICERGLEMWKLTGRERLRVNELILTGIVHRGGPNWQPEIWCPAFT
ncbi:hypothetical protein DFH05DRAFT_546905 [Lentinula detonsa]|uniref:Uncharacterized protein n=1 Tax=Lentinula detonsa TaxID=2804962 RepID=A0A9W8NRJ1_9AGAR|nr:hypothetical protein DFH05DRAFT_546905 [Lentinula detonsa]